VSYYAHTLYAPAPSLILHTHWELFDSPEFAHSGSCTLYFVDQVFRKDHTHYEDFKIFLYLMVLFLSLFIS